MNNLCQVIANTGKIQSYEKSKDSYDILCFKAFLGMAYSVV